MEEKEFEQLVRGMRERMYRTAMSILWNDNDSADAIQEALLKAWQRRGTVCWNIFSQEPRPRRSSA